MSSRDKLLTTTGNWLYGVFAPISIVDTIRIFIALAAQKGCSLYELDMKSAFLYGNLTEESYVEQPKGYVKRGSKNKVNKLHKGLV